VLNLVLVYGPGPFPHLGIAGSAWGSLLAQTVAAVAVTAVVVRTARATGAALRPDLAGIRRAARTGVPLFVRTLLLRAALLVMTYAAARYGDAELATMQLALTIWNFLAFVLDALGISAQTLVGTSLGRAGEAGDPAATRRLADRLVRWGLVYGLATGVVLLACATVLAHLFTADPRVLDLLPPVLVVAAVAQPVAGVVFVLDGILIGADDGPFLAAAQGIVLAAFAPAAAWAVAAGDLTWLWVAFAVAFMGGRCVLLLARQRGDAWLGRSLRPG
jgi:putative MATE family efflux protein